MKVSMKGIVKSFGANNVLRQVDFSVEGGEICALLGENGAGKSTLMNILGGVLQPDQVTIELDGKTVISSSEGNVYVDGQLVEGEEKRADVFLSNLDTDPGEKINLADEMPELCSELKEKAIEWRNGIETTWDEKFAMNYSSLT